MLMEGLAGKLLPRGKTYVGLKALGLGPRVGLLRGCTCAGYRPSLEAIPPPPIAFHRGLN